MHRIGTSGDNRVDAWVAQIAARQFGVVTYEQLLRCGLSARQIHVRVARGQLHRIHEGVYAVGHPGLTTEGRFFAAVAAGGPGAALSHLAACALHGLSEWRDSRSIDVLVEDTTPRSHEGVDVHRTLWLPPRDVTRVRGIAVTTPARSLADAAAQLNAQALRRAVRQGLALRRTSIPQLVEVVERLGPRRGSRSLRAVIVSGHQPTRSDLEDVTLDFLMRRYEPPHVNVPLWIDGHKTVPDFRWPEQQLIVEADSKRWHTDPVSQEDDAIRQARLEAHGERVVRVTWNQILLRSGQTYARLDAAGAPIVTSSTA